MRISTLLPFVDDRGVIQDVLTHTEFDAATIIRSRPGVIRGNHYHKETTQWLYVIEGELDYGYKHPKDTLPSGVLYIDRLRTGDMVYTPPGVEHAIRSITSSVCLVLTKGPRNGDDYESDTFRLEIPLIS